MTECNKYTKAFISQFADKEVSERERDGFIRHMAQCRTCAETEAQFRQINQTFTRHINSQVSHIRKELPPLSLEKKHGWFRLPVGLGLKLASLGAAALILMISLYPGINDPVQNPSAIVNSIDTYGSSVMIIESPNTQHTIIWFSEA
jgi:anti-sigma factor RsiW